MANIEKCLQCNEMGKLTRGLCHKDYSAAMKKIARGIVSEETLVKQKKLLPGKGITKGRDDKMFLLGAKTRGHASAPDQCLVRKCKNKRRNKRGLCVTHHSYAWDLIRKGKASEEDLVKRRLMRSKTTSISKKSSKKKPEAKKIGDRKETPLCKRKNCKFKARAKGLCRKHRNENRKKKGSHGRMNKPVINTNVSWIDATDAEPEEGSARW